MFPQLPGPQAESPGREEAHRGPRFRRFSLNCTVGAWDSNFQALFDVWQILDKQVFRFSMVNAFEVLACIIPQQQVDMGMFAEFPVFHRPFVSSFPTIFFSRVQTRCPCFRHHHLGARLIEYLLGDVSRKHMRNPYGFSPQSLTDGFERNQK